MVQPRKTGKRPGITEKLMTGMQSNKTKANKQKQFEQKSHPCADPGSFIRGGPTLTGFLVDVWRAIVSLPCWRANDGPTLNAGLVALFFFSGDPDQYC